MGFFGSKKHSIGKTIAELRKEKGWTQIELAEKLQVSDKAISKWEKDKGSPSVEFFPVIADLFGVSIDFLMTGKNSKTNVITISKSELCAKNEDISLLDEIDCTFKDENNKSLIDYIIQYKSYKVFVALCEKDKKNISKFKILDAISFAIISNRLDLLRGATFGLNSYARMWNFEDERELLSLLPQAVEKNFNQDVKPNCILTDEFFEMIVCNDKINQQTMDILLGKQKNRQCVWYHVYPYLIHQSYLHNKKEFFNKLLTLSESNNEYAYENMKLVIQYGECNFQPHFFFMGSSHGFGGHGLVRILEETIKLALERGDIRSVEKFNGINAAIVKYYDFKPYIASDYEIKMAKLKSDKSISKEELTIQSTIHDDIVNIDELLATKKLDLIKKVLENYPIHPFEILYKWFKEKNWRKLFEYAVDNNLNQIADSVKYFSSKNLEQQLANLFFQKTDYRGYPCIEGKSLEVRNERIHKSDSLDRINDYILAYKQQVLEDATYELKKETTVNELTKEYFESELRKGNDEMVVVKLCVRLESILRSTYHYEGDFSEMLNQYCNAHGQEDDGWGYNQEAKFVKYLQKLRKCRNDIVHSGKDAERLSLEEIRYCIDYICELN